MKAKIITYEKAVQMGLAGGGSPLVITGVVARKVGGKDEVMEVFKEDVKTKKREILFQHKDYKTLRQKQGIIN